MDIRQTLEYPLPVLTVSEKEIVIESEHDRSFNIRNSGGGVLEGRIISPSRCLTFEPSNWEGNRQKISCRFTPDPLDGWKPAATRTFSVIVLSNGGEAAVSVTVKMAKEAEKVREAGEIKGQDFGHNPDDIINLPDFKRHTTLSVPQPAIEHLRKPGDYTMVYGHFTVQKSDDGYIQADIVTEGPDAPWLLLTDQSLTAPDFNEDRTASVMYIIDPLQIPGRFAQGRVAIKTPDGEKEAAVDIIYNRMTPLRTWLSQEGYGYRDQGAVIIENQADEPLQIDIICNEPFIHFHQKRYKVDGQLNIPFTIKLSALQSAQVLLLKTPFLSAGIEIHAKYKGKLIRKTLSLTAGDILQKQLQNVKEPLSDGFNTKKTIGYALRNWLTYAAADVPEPREYLHQANYRVLSLLRKNGSDVRLFWLAAYFAIELGHLDKASEMLDKVYSYRFYYKRKHPFHYKVLHFLYAYLEIKQDRIKSARKYMSKLEAVKTGAEVSLMLGMLHLALEEYEEAYKLLMRSYDEGSRSVFLFNALFSYYRHNDPYQFTGHHQSQPLRRDLLLKTIHWAINHGADAEDVVTAYQEVALPETLIPLAEGIYLKFPNRWMLRELCLHYMAASDYGAKAYSYYRDAERRQVNLPDLSHFIVKAAFENRSEKVHHYTMAQYLEKSNESYETGEPDISDGSGESGLTAKPDKSDKAIHLKVYVYHLLLTDPSLSDLAAGLENDILQMSEYCLQNNIRSRHANSLYYFFWKKCSKQQIPGNNPDNTTKATPTENKIEKILLEDLCKFEVTDPKGTAQYLYIKEWEKQSITEYKFPEDGAPLIVKAVGGGFRYAALSTGRFRVLDQRLEIRRQVELADTALYYHFYKKGAKDFEVIAYLAKAYTEVISETGIETILKAALASDQSSKVFISQCNMAMGRLYYNRGRLDIALEYYGKTDENSLDDTSLEHMLTAFVRQQIWKKAAGLIERKGYRLKDRILFNAIRPIAAKEQARWHPVVANNAYQLLLHSHYDKNLLEVVLAHFTGTQKQWLDLSKALSAVSIRDLRLDKVILKNAVWAHHFDEDTQRVFVRSAGSENVEKSFEKSLRDFVYYAVHEMIIKKIKPLPETIAAFERIYMDHPLLAYGLCHVYLEHGINTARSGEIIQAAVCAQQESGILFPIFRRSKNIRNSYIEKYRPFMYKTLPGKNVRLYYKVDEEEDWRIKDMNYWRFGLYLTCVPHFYNEKLTYYFSEELPTGSIATQEEEIYNRDVYLDDGQRELFFIINNAVIYEQMFRYEQVEDIIGDLVKDVRTVRSRLM